MLGPPSIWLTINPSDIHDPIAQVFAGEDIDLDDFLNSVHLDNKRRANNIANDPFAASKFFNFMIETILVRLFGVRTTAFHVVSEKGVFGEVAAYFGAVESQGRGTLHFHCLLWLKHAPSADQMQEFLRSDGFCSQMQDYIKTNIHAYVPGLEDEESVKAIPVRSDITFN